MNSFLEVIDLSINFGGVAALSGVSFSMRKGEILSLIGPNGAGKTTVLNIITGFYFPDRGQVIFGGEDISNLSPHVIRKKGIARTFQKSELFSSMTVLENIMVGLHNEIKTNVLSGGLGLKKARDEERGGQEKANEILNFVGLSSLRDLKASDLPLGFRKILELGRAIAIPPQLLLLDEPVAGLNETEIVNIEKVFKRISEQLKVTILIIEHNMNFVMKISDRITVLDYGKKIAEGCPGEIKNNPVVIEAYLGRKR